MKLIYSQQSGSITNQTGTWQITAAPVLGFAYDGIFYDSENNIGLKYMGEGRTHLTEDELKAVDKFLANAVMPKPIPPDPLAVVAALRLTMEPLTAWQMRKALDLFNLRDTVESWILTADKATQDAWNLAESFKRTDHILLGVVKLLNLTDDHVDQMFIVGATL